MRFDAISDLTFDIACISGKLWVGPNFLTLWTSDMKTAHASYVHNVRHITFGEITQVLRKPGETETPWMVTMYIAFNDDTASTEITLIAPTHDALVVMQPLKISDDEQAAIDNSDPHPMRRGPFPHLAKKDAG